MYAWQVLERGEWNIIGAYLGTGLTPLVTTRKHVYDKMRSIAVVHADETGLPVRGVRYGEPDFIEDV